MDWFLVQRYKLRSIPNAFSVTVAISPKAKGGEILCYASSCFEVLFVIWMAHDDSGNSVRLGNPDLLQKEVFT